MVVAQQTEIKLAGVKELDDLTPLFDAYRVFYKQPSNLPAANHFLFERIINHEFVIYIAYQDGIAAGFVQLYPTFSSVAMNQQWVLNDLYVKPEYRRQRIAEKLITAAIHLVKERGDRGLTLETAVDNTTAQALYNKMGFKAETNFKQYYLYV